MTYLNKYSDVVVPLDNNAIYDICKRSLDIERPTYTNMNRLIAQAISSLTTSLRFDGALNADLAEFETNLVPYPRINYMLTSYAPFLSIEKSYCYALTAAEICNLSFEPHTMLAKCDPKHGKYMACSLMFRGNLVPPEINAAVATIKTKLAKQLIYWFPGFKVGLNYERPRFIPGGDFHLTQSAVSMISNSSAIDQVFSRISHNFDLMFSKRAFVRTLVDEGMEEGEIEDARDDLDNLQTDYAEINIYEGEEEEGMEWDPPMWLFSYINYNL